MSVNSLIVHTFLPGFCKATHEAFNDNLIWTYVNLCRTKVSIWFKAQDIHPDRQMTSELFTYSDPLFYCFSACVCVCDVMAVNRCCRLWHWAEPEFEPDSLQPRHSPEDPEKKTCPLHPHSSGQNHYPENSEYGRGHGFWHWKTRSVSIQQSQCTFLFFSFWIKD